MTTTDALAERGAGAVDGDDVVELILADYRLFEELLRALRNREEERDVLNAAREEVADDVRAGLGRAFRSRRAELLEGSPGDPRNVGRLVAEADRKGLLD